MKNTITIGENTYHRGIIKSRMVRRTFELNERMNFNNLSAEDLDELLGFVCEIFEYKFNIDDIYDNVPADELLPMLVEQIQSITEKTTVALEKFPKNE